MISLTFRFLLLGWMYTRTLVLDKILFCLRELGNAHDLFSVKLMKCRNQTV